MLEFESLSTLHARGFALLHGDGVGVAAQCSLKEETDGHPSSAEWLCEHLVLDMVQ